MFIERIFSSVNQKFFKLFEELAIQMQNMSVLFCAIARCDGDITYLVTEMEKQEHGTSALINTLFDELGRNLITPFDREDIHFLATDLSNISRNVLHVSKQIRNYGISDDAGFTLEIAEKNHEAIMMLAQILKELKDARRLAKLRDVCASINAIEGSNHDRVDEAIIKLFGNEPDERKVIKMLAHYEALQRMCGRINDAVNVCESIIIKYS